MAGVEGLIIGTGALTLGAICVGKGAAGLALKRILEIYRNIIRILG